MSLSSSPEYSNVISSRLDNSTIARQPLSFCEEVFNSMRAVTLSGATNPSTRIRLSEFSSAACLLLASARMTAAASEAEVAWAIASAFRPEGSTNSGITPASNRRRQMLALLRLAANMSGVSPAPSRAFRSSPRRICSLTAVSTPATTAIFRSWFRGRTGIMTWTRSHRAAGCNDFFSHLIWDTVTSDKAPILF